MPRKTPSSDRIRKDLLPLGAALLCLAVAVPAFATPPFTSDLLIDVIVEFDGFVEGAASQEGLFSVIEGGAETPTFFLDDLTLGDNPLFGTLTDFGDGVLIEGAGSALGGGLEDFLEGLYAADIGVFFTIENTSLTDTYKVTFDVSFLNEVDAADVGDEDDEEAFAFSAFAVDSPFDTEVLSVLLSDPLFGDIKNDEVLTTFGAPLDDAGLSFFDVIVAPSTVAFVDAFWLHAGGVLSEEELESFSVFGGSITIGDVMLVPAPGTVLLLGAGLVAIGAARRRRTR